MKRKHESEKMLAKTGASPAALVSDARELILSARRTGARGVNAALVLLRCQIGQRIRKDILAEKRAENGEEIVATVSRQLSAEFGRGFAEKNLRRMVQVAQTEDGNEG